MATPENYEEFHLENLIDQAAVEVPEQVEQRDNPFRLIRFGDLLDRPPKQYLVPSWFGLGDHCMIYGDSGSGKTFQVIDLIVRGALGLPIADQFQPERPFSTLYCTEEGGTGIAQRVQAAAQHYGLTRDSEAAGRIAHFELVPKLFYPESAEEGLDEFIEAVRESGFAPDVIVLDTLADVSEGSNENDNGHIATINRRARRIREALNCTTIYIHHTPKSDPTSARGGGAGRGKADLMLLVEGTSGTRTLQCAKLKDGPPFRTLAWNLEACGDSAVIKWFGADRPETLGIQDTKRRHVAAIIETLREHATHESQALLPKQIIELMEAPPTDRQMRAYMQGLREDPLCMVRGVKLPTTDKNGAPNKPAWGYWIDLTVIHE